MEENGVDRKADVTETLDGAPAPPFWKSRYRFLLFGILLLVGAAFVVWRGGRLPTGQQGESGEPGVLYLAWDEKDHAQIFLTADMGATTRQLTEAAYGVDTYHPSPNGRRIAYSAGRVDGGADIWLVNADGSGARLVLTCEAALCGGPVWRPDGQVLLYERRELRGEGEDPAPPRLYWLDPGSGESVSFFQEEEAWGHLARFSADGRWLAYIMPLRQQLRAVNIETNEIVSMPNELGESVRWHPRRPVFLFTDMHFYQGESFVSHIYRADLSGNADSRREGDFGEAHVSSLSGDGSAFSDSVPSWSPQGDRLAFGRKLPRTPTGRQIWVMDADGSNQRRVTEEVTLQFSRPLWSPVGERLLVQRFDIEAPSEPPGVWLLDVESGVLEEIVTPGFRASWLP